MPSKRLQALTRDGGEQPLLQYSPMCGVWALTTYDACDLRCSYCASYAQGPSEPLASKVEVRDLLRLELESVPTVDTISIGPIIDGYTHAEGEHEVTRAALEVLIEDGRQLVIVTKGTLIERDIDLLSAYDKVRVCVSLPSFDEGVLARIEPQAPTAAERMTTIERLHAAGVDVELHVQPWIPEMTDAVEMVAWAAGRFDTWFAPLNIQNPVVARTGFGKRFTQEQINEAYVAEMKRVGPRARVQWARPLWLGEELLAMSAWDVPASECHYHATDEQTALGTSIPVGPPMPSAPDPEQVVQRDLATTVRLLEVMAQDRLGVIGMEVLSAHMRVYAGRYPERTTITEGPSAMTRFWNLYRSLADHQGTVHEVRADGPVVHARYSITGTLLQPLEGLAAGDTIVFDVAGTFRYDDYGLLIELWQEIESTRRGEPALAGDAH